MESMHRDRGFMESFFQAVEEQSREFEENYKKQKAELERIGIPEVVTCPECNRKTETVPKKIVLPSEPMGYKICDSCIEKKEEKKRIEKLEEERQEDIERMEKFMEKIPESFKNNLVFNQNKTLLTETMCIIFGPYGVGKTHTAYSLIKKLYEEKEIGTWEIKREIQIVNELRQNPVHTTEMLTKYCDLLVIDEFGKVNDTDFTKAQIFNIIDERNDWNKKTILICNASNNEEISKIIPVAIQDRFKHGIVYIGGKTRR